VGSLNKTAPVAREGQLEGHHLAVGPLGGFSNSRFATSSNGIERLDAGFSFMVSMFSAVLQRWLRRQIRYIV